MAETQQYPLSQESQLDTFYPEQIQPFWQQQMTLGQFIGVDSVPIQYAFAVHPDSIGSVVISSGRIEGMVKYKELAYDLYQQGYSVFIHDHRGQGVSGRMTARYQQGYVDSFDDYVADMKQFYQQVIIEHSQHQPMLLCHSMGSAIGALYVLAHPQDFACVAFSAPMFGILPPLPFAVAKPMLAICSAVNSVFSDQPWYFFGQDDYQPDAFDDNELTHSAMRYQIFRDEYEQQPDNKLGGVTIQWLKAAYRAMKQIELRAEGIAIPVLHLQALGDLIVDNDRQNKVSQRIPNCTKVTFEGAFHELLMEKDSIRHPCLQQILTFFAANKPAPAG